jgi:DNA-binding winged helix-turn-helix (wHTH) protein
VVFTTDQGNYSRPDLGESPEENAENVGTHVSSVSGSCFSFGVFTIDLRARKLLRGSDAVHLPARAFDSLAYLVTNAGQPLDKNEDHRSAAWRDARGHGRQPDPRDFGDRRALGDDPEQPSFIETIPRFGYRFVTTTVVPWASIPRREQRLLPRTAPAAEASTPRKVRHWREALALEMPHACRRGTNRVGPRLDQAFTLGHAG